MFDSLCRLFGLKKKHRPVRKSTRAPLSVEMLEDRTVPTLLGNQLFPSDNPWNQMITNAPVAANSSAIINNIVNNYGDGRLHPDFGQNYGTNRDLYGIPYNIVHGNSTPKVNVVIDAYPDESDLGGVPIPANPVLENDLQSGPRIGVDARGDSHLIIYDVDNNIAYELYRVSRPNENADGRWHADQQTIWNMNTNTYRTIGHTSADAAGLSILAGLVRPDEALPVSQGGQGVINHAIRVTLQNSIILDQFLYPASHVANSGSNELVQPPMGARFRLKSSVDISQLHPQSRIIAQAMKDYGMIVADNGSNFFFSGASSSVNASNQLTLTWNDNDIQDSLRGLKSLHYSDFEVVDLTPIVTDLSVHQGPAGTQVTVIGQNFSGASGQLKVHFGSTVVSSVTYIDDSHLIVTAPAGAGTVDVRVQSGVSTAPDSQNVKSTIFGYGISAANANARYTFGVSTGNTAPTVATAASASPNPVNGTTTQLSVLGADDGGAANLIYTWTVLGKPIGSANPTFQINGTNAAQTTTATFSASGAYTFQVTIRDAQGLTASSNATVNVTIPTTPPNTPSGTITSDMPTFTWSAVNGVSRYAVRVVDAAGLVALNVTNLTGTSWTPSTAQALTPGRSYTWYLGTINNAGAVSYGPGTSFTIAPLATPTQLAPVGTIAATAGYDRPTFTWSAVAGAHRYHLYVVNVTTGRAVLDNPHVSGTSFTATAPLTPGHRFTWYVGAVSTNGKVNSYLPAGQTFTLAALPTPVQSGPSGTIAASAGYDQPTFNWSAVAGADHYYLYVVDLTTGRAALENPNVSGTSVTLGAAQALTPGHSFVWYVGAVSADNQVISYLPAGRTFTLAALSAPTQSGPTGTIAAVAGYDRPTFTWSAVAGASRYYLYVVDNVTGQAVITNPNVSGTSFTPAANQALTPGHSFTWYVGAISTNGQVNRYAPAGRSFSLASLSAPPMLGPGGVISSTTPTFSWTAVNGADRYYLYVVDLVTNTAVIDRPGLSTTSFTPTTPLLRGHRYVWYIGAISTNGLVNRYLVNGLTFQIV